MSNARSVLRNRKEHKDYSQPKTQSLTPVSIFNKPPVIDPLFQEIIEDVKKKQIS